MDLRDEMFKRLTDGRADWLGDDYDLSETDRAQLLKHLERDRANMFHGLAAAWRGWIDDNMAFTRPWGFDVADIRIPVLVKYGRTDVLVPPAHGDWLAAHIPNVEVWVDDDAGHMGDDSTVERDMAWMARPVRAPEARSPAARLLPSAAMTRSLLADAFDHHVWATQQLMDSCAGLTADQLASTVPGTYGTILDTVRHIVGADCNYLAVLTDGAIERIDEASMELSELRSTFDRVSQAWPGFLAGDVDPDQDYVRYRDDGSEAHAPLGIRLAQVLVHGTDHRSQIATALSSWA